VERRDSGSFRSHGDLGCLVAPFPSAPELRWACTRQQLRPASDSSKGDHCGALTVRGGSASTTLNKELWTSR
jgi:hypothetical protein